MRQRPIECEPTGRHDATDMGMMLEVLSPGMQHTEHPDVGAEMLRVASDLEHGGGAGAEEKVIEESLVL